MNDLEIQIDKTNVEQQIAFDIVANTNTCVFITGKAGTGKTTFIKRIQEEIKKNFLVLAPTGIAAIAAGGQTMHSFFHFPMEIIGPHTPLNVTSSMRILLNAVDTIIVDEASMVRSDMVDGMDRILRTVFNTHMPFGGKQVVFVGDLFQLPPVVQRGTAEHEMLCDLYGAGVPYFYKAHVLKRINLPKIEFKKNYRQTNAEFVGILNRMRIGESTLEDLKIINQRIQGQNSRNNFTVTLTAYNNMAEMINERKLDELESKEYFYDGIIEGKFKRSDCPVPERLKLKVGAQVIFCRNDFSHNCANGTIAKVVELGEDYIRIELENGAQFNMEKMIWESKEKVYNRETKKLESEVVGSYTQYPLKLAWAITIHKSQGMTFDRMHLDLSRGTFASGQAYVAISRMRTLEGLTLSHPLMLHHIKQNSEIRAFSNSFNDAEMINDELALGRVVYKHLVNNDFDKAAKACLEDVIRKIEKGNYRNAALIAKRMFDIMLDDTSLKGLTSEISLIKDCSMTGNFLNAVLCLYANRFDEAIGYADMVLSRRQCLEAMFIKGRALYELEKYNEAYVVNYQMIATSKKGESKQAIDKKQYLFEARLNECLGNSNIETCKHLIKIYPECIEAYLILRRELHKNDLSIPLNEVEKENANGEMDMVIAFNLKSMKEFNFKLLLTISTKNKDKSHYRLMRKILRYEIENTEDSEKED